MFCNSKILPYKARNLCCPCKDLTRIINTSYQDEYLLLNKGFSFFTSNTCENARCRQNPHQ